MKKEMFLGLLVMAGVSFALEMPAGPGFNTLAQACCQGEVAEYMANTVAQNYYVWDGQGCPLAQMPYDGETLYFEICDQRDGVWAYYLMVAQACGQGQGTDCFNAYRQFYSRASAARGMFSATKTAYLSAARQALYANQRGLCQTAGPQTVSYDLAYTSAMYRECMQDPWDCIEDCDGGKDE